MTILILKLRLNLCQRKFIESDSNSNECFYLWMMTANFRFWCLPPTVIKLIWCIILMNVFVLIFRYVEFIPFVACVTFQQILMGVPGPSPYFQDLKFIHFNTNEGVICIKLHSVLVSYSYTHSDGWLAQWAMWLRTLAAISKNIR